MDGNTKINWTAVGALATVAAVVIACLVWWDTRAKEKQDKDEESAKLLAPPGKLLTKGGVVPAAEYKPWGPEMPTRIPFRNDGKREALVKQVILSNWKWKRTPNRPNLYGAGKKISVTFEPRHYVKETEQYMLVLREPAPAPGGGQWTTLEVLLVDPNAVGQTFVGTVTIVFDGLEQMPFHNVQLDVLKHVPQAQLEP